MSSALVHFPSTEYEQVERAITKYLTGVFCDDQDKGGINKFSNDHWGGKTDKYAKKICEIRADTWEMLLDIADGLRFKEKVVEAEESDDDGIGGINAN